jgi:hypothetical protein
MFCYTALKKAPRLAATTLGASCYAGMFQHCSALEEASALPATTLAAHCYQGMYNDCDSLKSIPALPATVLQDECYANMFQNSASLKFSTTQTGEYQIPYRIPTSGDGTSATDALDSMLSGTGGTFTDTPSINTTYWLSNTLRVVYPDTDIEYTQNKVTTIDSNSTDIQYPSAKAVYDAVQAEVTDIPSSSVNFDDLPKIEDYAGPSGTGRFVTFLQNETGDTYTNPYLLDAPVAMMYRVKTNSIVMNNGLGIGRQKLGITGTSASYVGSTNTLFCMIANTPIMVDTTTYAPTSNLITDGIKLGFRFVGSVIYADNSEAVIDTYAIVSYSSTSGWSASYTMFGNHDFVISLSTTFKTGRLSIVVGPAAMQKTFEKTLSDFKVFRCCNLRIDYMGASTGDYPSGTSDLSELIEPSSGWLFSFYQHDNTQTWTDAVSAVQPNIPGTLLDAKEDISNKVTSVDSTSTDDQYPSAKLLYTTQNTLSGLIQDVDEDAEKTAHKVTSISSSSTDTQYPSAKCVYDNFSLNTHTHGNLTNDGKIGSTANQAVYTTTGGAITAGTLPAAITNAAISSLPTWSAVPTDSTYLLRRDTGGSAAYGQVQFSTVNSYIKTKNPVLNHLTYDSTEEAVKFIFT